VKKNKIYFISDVHLGLYPVEKSLKRERLLVKWLDEIKHEAAEIYLLGDIFDFWHEYKHVVPKGFTRFLGKLSELADMGVRFHFFSGNHDVWIYNYFETEFCAKVYHKPLITTLHGLKFFLAHGDGLGPGDRNYKILKSFFRNRVLQFLFARLHPDFALWLGGNWSKHSRNTKAVSFEKFLGPEKEMQILFAKDYLKLEPIDCFVFGHRHIPWDIQLGEHSRIVNLGDWIRSFTYAVLEDKDLKLKVYGGDESIIHRDKYSI
jgi:UDP-2,3-diacylglucosamine hydrolase